jgi:hypothetical protein
MERMQRLAVVAIVLAVLAGGWLFAQDDVPRRRADHVVLVSIDGMRPEFYLDSRWPAPMIQHLAAEGARAEAMQPVFPSVTYPNHTSLVTGVLPARHGIFYNTPFEPEGQTGRWYWAAEHIRVPTLWTAARAAGLVTAAVSWPVTVGADIDFNMPEVWPLEQGVDRIEYLRGFCSPPGLLAEVEARATGRLRPDSFSIESMTLDDHLGAAAAYLLEAHRPHLLLVHLITPDHFQHEDGRDSPRVRRAVAAADRSLSRLWEAAGRAGIRERTAFIVVGDHGHVDRHTTIAPNRWLVEAGLLDPTADRGRWRAAFHTTGASAFLHLADPADEAAVAEARQALGRLPAATRRSFRIVDRDQLDRLGAAPEAAFALAPMPGVDVSPSFRRPDIRSARGATHGYLPEVAQVHTGLVAWGAGIRAGASAPMLHITDVAPLVAELLGLKLEALDGMAPIGFLTPSPATR